MSDIGAIIGAISSSNSASTAADSESAALALQANEWNTNQANQAPWLKAGQTAVGQMSTGLQAGGQFASATPTLSQLQIDPGYAFRLQQGSAGIAAGAAAGGNYGSGNLGVALETYGQNMGSQEYQAAYNRWQGEQTTDFNRLASVSGLGQTAANQLGTTGPQMASNAGNVLQTGAAQQGYYNTQAANNLMSGVNSMGQQALQGFNAYNYNNDLYNMQQYPQNYLAGNQAAYGNSSGEGWE